MCRSWSRTCSGTRPTSAPVGKRVRISVGRPGKQARRWVAERAHGWLSRFRRILTRWERKSESDLALLEPVCADFMLKRAEVFGWTLNRNWTEMTALQSMLSRVVIAVAAIVLLPNVFISDIRANSDNQRPSRESSERIIWRASRACGLNCAYLLLRCAGHQPDYLAMDQELIQQELTSLADIRDAVAAHGEELILAKMTPDDLTVAPKPVIAHLDIIDYNGRVGGHFVLVVETNHSGVRYVDGTTAEINFSSWRDFQRKWSGFSAYLPARRNDLWLTGAFGVVIGLLLGVGWEFVAARKRLNVVRMKAAIRPEVSVPQ